MTLHGGIITRRPLCYTADGKLIVAPCGNDIRVYSAQSGEHVASLRGHSAEVTATVQDPNNGQLLLSSSYDGTIKRWNIYEGHVEQTWHVGSPIESMVYSSTAGMAYVSLRHKGGHSGRVVAYLLPSGQEGPGRIKTSCAGQLVISPSGQYVAVMDRHSCFVWAAGASSTGARAKPLNLPHTKPYTCAAFAADDSSIALGDASGRITIWHNFTQALQLWSASPATAATAAVAAEGSGGVRGSTGQELPPCTTVHWHASAVGALCFSRDANYLLSGGQEGVLVVWSLPSMTRNYLPRLGGPIKGIAASTTDPARFCLSQSDNTIRLINTATMRVEASVHGLRPAPPSAALAAAGYGSCCAAASSSPAGVLVQPHTGHVVLPAEHAMLQFFDTQRDRHVARLQVCPRNPVVTAPTTHQAAQAAQAAAAGLSLPPVLVPAVVLVSFTADSGTLVTVDVRPSTTVCDFSTESTLRFWEASSSSQVAGAAAPYTLNTTTDNPHRGTITSLACHPQLNVVATTGSEGEFRVWTRSTPRKADSSSPSAEGSSDGSPNGSSSSSHWRCSAVGSYKGLPLRCCSFSPDGSLLAVGAGCTATLWDPQDNTLVASLVAPPEFACSGHQLRHLVFLQNSPHVVGVLGGGDASLALEAVGLGAGQQQQQPVDVAASCWGHGVVVWNLLTGAVRWYTHIPVCSMAADPVHSVFAVGIPAVLSNSSSATAAAAAKQQPQQLEQQGLVLVFGADRAQPLYAGAVPHSSPTSLLFTQQKTAAAAAATPTVSGSAKQQQQQQQVSELTVLTQDRSYTRMALGLSTRTAASAGEGQRGASAVTVHVDEVPSGMRAALEAELAAGRESSALEAMFGKLAPATPGRDHEGSAAAAAAEAAAVREAVVNLFDAPSHVLPAPSSLCPSLLQLLIGANRRV